jgi:hypothetical protein
MSHTTTIATIHAAVTANSLFKAYAQTRDTGKLPKVQQLVTVTSRFSMAFDQYFLAVPDGGDWPNNESIAPQIAVSQVAFQSLNREAAIILDNLPELFTDDKFTTPTDEFLQELNHVAANNYRDARSHNDIDRLYIPGEAVKDDDTYKVDERYTAFLVDEVAGAANKVVNMVPASFKGRREGASFGAKSDFTAEDILRLDTVQFMDIPDAADALEIDHPQGTPDVFIPLFSGIEVHLDTNELVIAEAYFKRMMAWRSHVNRMDSEDAAMVYELAAEKIRDWAAYGIQLRKQQAANRVDSVLGAA